MAATQAELDALERAIALGVTSTRYTAPDGSTRSIEYRSLDEMFRIRDLMQAELGKPRTTTRVATSTRGLGA